MIEIVANQGFTHGPYRLKRNEACFMPEPIARRLMAVGLVSPIEAEELASPPISTAGEVKQSSALPADLPLQTTKSKSSGKRKRKADAESLPSMTTGGD